MALINTWEFTHTVVNGDAILEATRNEYRVVSVRQYVDKKGKLKDGYTLTLMVLYDDHDYGVDKNGVPRENNVFQTFDVTVFSRAHDVHKGDYVRLIDFDEEHSYAINFDLILRFRDYEVLPGQTGGKPQCAKGTQTD